MKKIRILILLFVPLFGFGQTFKMTIHPNEDVYEHRSNYKSLFSNRSYGLEFWKYKDSLRFVTDTNLIMVKNGDLIVKNIVGNASLKIYNVNTNKLLINKNFIISNEPVVTLTIDKKVVEEKIILNVNLFNEKGENCTKKYRLASIMLHLYDSNNKYFLSLTEMGLSLPVSEEIFKEINSITTECRLIDKVTGLSFMVSEMEIGKNNIR